MRWNREKDKSVIKSLAGMDVDGDARPVIAHRDRPVCGAEFPAAADAADPVSTQGAGASIQNTRRDDIWQGYQRLIGCADRFLYMENQYFREPRMADAIVNQAKAQKELVVIVVVPSETDDLPDAGKKHGDSRQHEFFVRLTERHSQEPTRGIHDVPPDYSRQVHHGRRPRAVPRIGQRQSARVLSRLGAERDARRRGDRAGVSPSPLGSQPGGRRNHGGRMERLGLHRALGCGGCGQ